MYTQSITRTHRTAIILRSTAQGRWPKRFGSATGRRIRAEAVATITTDCCSRLIERARRSDGSGLLRHLRDRTYSGDDEVYSLLPGVRG